MYILCKIFGLELRLGPDQARSVKPGLTKPTLKYLGGA